MYRHLTNEELQKQLRAALLGEVKREMLLDEVLTRLRNGSAQLTPSAVRNTP